MNTVAIIQARMGSSRLPGKVLADINGKTMLERIIERVASAQSIDSVVIATTDAQGDDVLIEYVSRNFEYHIFRGSVDNVLSRFYKCAKFYSADVIVRITADDPLKDAQIIDRAVSLLNATPTLDYCSNTLDPTYPEGLDVEVIRFSALERAYFESNLDSEKEHVTPYIWKNPQLFNLVNFKFERNLSHWRWTVDRPEDLEFMRSVFDKFKNNPLVSYQDVIAWLEKNPDIGLINSGVARNEGYKKSLQLENNHAIR